MKKNEFTEIYYSNVDNLFFENYINKLPQLRIDKVKRYHFKKDKVLCVYSWIILQKALLLHNIHIDNYEYKELDNGKPVLLNCPLYFSISHSGTYVVVAISTSPVGIDIEEMRDFKESVFNFISNNNDKEFLKTSNDKVDSFYKIWTSKEALYKQNSTLQGCPFNKIFINYQSKNLTEINEIPLYKISVAHETEITSISKIEL